MNITNLAQFKRFLAEPGATVQIIRNDWMDASKTIHPLSAKPGYFEPKQVAKVQSNSVQFTTGSWLQFPKAAHVRFAGDEATFDLNQDGTFTAVLVYKLSRA